jgi:hypothetical protein
MLAWEFVQLLAVASEVALTCAVWLFCLVSVVTALVMVVAKAGSLKIADEEKVKPISTPHQQLSKPNDLSHKTN